MRQQLSYIFLALTHRFGAANKKKWKYILFLMIISVRQMLNVGCHHNKGSDNIQCVYLCGANMPVLPVVLLMSHAIWWCFWHPEQCMMTSSNGNIFRVAGPLYAEFTGHLWNPRTKVSGAGLWCFFDLRLNKRLSKQSWGWWSEAPSRSLWCHCNGIPKAQWYLRRMCRQLDILAYNRRVMIMQLLDKM